MNASVLLVEDDADIANLVALYLRKDHFGVTIASTGEEALEHVRAGGWDLFLLDVNLPDIDGFKVLEELRKRSNAPVIVVTARTEDADAIYGLAAGADEFVTKPFSPKVLVARVRALLRRAGEEGPGAARPEVYRFGCYVLDVEACTLKSESGAISLPPREFELLCYLVRRAGAPHTPQEIYDEVWKTEYGDLASVAVHVQRLRRRIEPDPRSPIYICTQHGYGYLFNAETLL